MDVLAHAGSHVFRIEDATLTAMTALKLRVSEGQSLELAFSHIGCGQTLPRNCQHPRQDVEADYLRQSLLSW
jgi:hypothetical protein